jgi:hypothetical protein
MKYAQFFYPSAVNRVELIEACGDRAVIIFDGRESRATHERIARDECAKRGYLAFQIRQGESFSRSNAASLITHI